MYHIAGRVGMPITELFRMSLRQMMRFIEGHMESVEHHFDGMRNVVFSASKFNAVCTAQSKKQAQAISRHRFDWEKRKSSNNKKPVTYGSILPMLKAVFKNEQQA